MYILHFIVYIHRYFTNKKYLKKFLYDFSALFFYNPILYKTYKNLNTGELSSFCYQIPNKNNHNNKLFGFMVSKDLLHSYLAPYSQTEHHDVGNEWRRWFTSHEKRAKSGEDTKVQFSEARASHFLPPGKSYHLKFSDPPPK